MLDMILCSGDENKHLSYNYTMGNLEEFSGPDFLNILYDDRDCGGSVYIDENIEKAVDKFFSEHHEELDIKIIDTGYEF